MNLTSSPGSDQCCDGCHPLNPGTWTSVNTLLLKLAQELDCQTSLLLDLKLWKNTLEHWVRTFKVGKLTFFLENLITKLNL